MDFLVVLRRAQCIQPVITIPPGPDYWAYAMTYGFERMKNLSRISSLCCFANIRADTCNKIAVVWRWKKRLRRKIEEFSGYAILSQKNPCRLGSVGGFWGGVYESSPFSVEKNPGGCPLVLQRCCLFFLGAFWLLWPFWGFASAYSVKHLRANSPSQCCSFHNPSRLSCGQSSARAPCSLIK